MNKICISLEQCRKLIELGIDRKTSDMYYWCGEELRIDGFKFFDGIKAYNNEGSYYLLKDNEKGYAVIGRGFRRVGEWYDTEEEAHRAWRDYHPRP